MMAKHQIEAAAMTRASAVKFQLFTAQELYGPKVKNTQFEKEFNRFALPREWVKELAELAKDEGLDFLCTAFSVDGYEFVHPYVKAHKIASCELFDEDIVDWCVSSGKRFYWSDGCGTPEKVYFESYGKATRMACVTKYPAQILDYDLGQYHMPYCGLSDHTLTCDLAIMAYGLGCRVFEKHVDLSQGFRRPFEVQSPDSSFALNDYQFLSYVITLSNMDKIEDSGKDELRTKYGRQTFPEGCFRPIPENADLNLPVGDREYFITAKT